MNAQHARSGLVSHLGHVVFAVLALIGLNLVPARAQQAPPNGPPPNPPRVHALTNARVVVAPGNVIDSATVVIRDGMIEAVGPDAEIPGDARVWDLDGRTVHAGLIDAWVPVDAPEDPPASSARHWNKFVKPEVKAVDLSVPDNATATALREMGFTTALLAPDHGVFRGTAAVRALGDSRETSTVYLADGPQVVHHQTTGWGDDSYPSALIGAIALVRQTLLDAQWYQQCWEVYERSRTLEPPDFNASLDALRPVFGGVSTGPVQVGELGDRRPILFEAQSDLDALRAAKLRDEFGINVIVRGSGEEYQHLSDIIEAGLTLIVPLNFPETPNVENLEDAERIDLRTLMAWEQAPTNPRRLIESGLTVALTTGLLENRKDFFGRLRDAMDEGLTEEQALAALTTTPAAMLGLDGAMGTVEAGKIANLVVIDGTEELFGKDRKVMAVWVDGERYEVNSDPLVDPTGEWMLAFNGGGETYTLQITGEPDRPKVKLEMPGAADDADVEVDAEIEEEDDAAGDEAVPDPDEASDVDAPQPEDEPQDEQTTESEESDADVEADVEVAEPDAADDGEVKGDAKPKGHNAKAVTLREARLAFALPGKAFGRQGWEQFTGVIVDGEIRGVATAADGSRHTWTASRVQADDEAAEDADEADKDGQGDDDEDDEEQVERAPETYPIPLGAYGLTEPREAPEVIFVRDATVWTCAEDGEIIEDCDVLIEDGKIKRVGRSLKAPGDAFVIEAAGKHLSPGLLDCHSHTGIDRWSVNEGTDAITSEVRIADVINPDDINWYRQLAGGLTIANQLHGSANPIGGQNSVVKLRWGGGPDDFRFVGAPAGIKFALGENVKQSNWGENYTTRYPQSRMGVEQIIRAGFQAAADYKAEWDRYRALSERDRAREYPPRRDLRLDALVEILEGERLVHCHSYRQDEILMLIRVADDFGFRIGTLQHILEGYKVAAEIAEHGAGASTFSDWWAYKFEVYDAIPYNGALMHQVGVTVSFNSDSSELARRLNWEAAKAVKYGGVDPHEALKFVTLNPAKQLGIDDRVGSIEPGKDADFVIWSGSPLSTLSRCEQTWIEGVRMFSLEDDAKAREFARAERQRIIQKILREELSDPDEKKDDAGAKPADEGTPPPGVEVLSDGSYLLPRGACGCDLTTHLHGQEGH